MVEITCGAIHFPSQWLEIMNMGKTLDHDTSGYNHALMINTTKMCECQNIKNAWFGPDSASQQTHCGELDQNDEICDMFEI